MPARVPPPSAEMKRKRILRVGAAFVAAVVTALALKAARGEPGHGRRFEASFGESTAALTDRIAGEGVFQLVNTGAGTVDPFGQATTVIGITQDRAVQPCGVGSWTNAAVRRIALRNGVLVVRELVHVCPTGSELLGLGRWNVDGASSTGAFAGARGGGESRLDLATRTSTLTGEIELEPR